VRWIFASLAAALSVAGAGGLAAERSITILADPYCPYNCAEGAAGPGFGIEIARRIYEPQGYAVRYLTDDWNSALERVRQGQADAVIGTNRMEARSFIYPAAPFARAANCFFTNHPSWTFDGEASLARVRIGVIRGYSYGASIDRYVGAHAQDDRVLTASGVAPLDDLLLALEQNQIHAFVEDEAVVAFKLKAASSKTGLRRAGCTPPAGVYIAFSPAPARAIESRRLAALWSQGFEALRRSGELAAIYRRYQ
jgi:polar amino acid transport system substrate-binding protein